MIPLFKVAMSAQAKAAVAAVLDSGYIGQGQQEEAFEAEFSSFVGHPVLLTNSGTSSLELAVYMLGVGPGDEVISTPMTCTATNGAVVHLGAKLVWADVDPYTGLIDPFDVARKITKKTKAIMAVDWGGRPCEYSRLRNLGVPVIEDAAHMLKITETHGDWVAWSFQAIKHLTCGDGGALLVPQDQHERARLLKWYGLDRHYSESLRCTQPIIEAGFKYHMNDISAAIGRANMHTAKLNQTCNAYNAEYYIRHMPLEVLSARTEGHSYWLFTILVNNRDGFVKYMKGKGIEAGRVHSRNDLHPAFRTGERLPGVDFFDAHQVSIPVGWWVTPKDREKIVAAVNEWVWGV